MSTPTQTPTSTKKAALPPDTADADARSKKSRKRVNWRKLLFRLHGWLGLNLGLLLFVICFAGSVATLSHEIDWLLNPDIRAEAHPGQPYDWTGMHEAIRSAFPDGENLGVYAPEEPGFAARAYVGLPTGQTRKVYLNPYTGAVQGHTSFFNTQRFFRSFHRRFFDGDRGIVIVTLCAFVLLLSAASGFVYYKGWLKQLVTLRRGKGVRIFWSDLHKGAGIWGLLFTLLIALTGVFYFVEVGFQGANNYDALLPKPLPQVKKGGLGSYGPQPKLLPADAYVKAAREALPGLEVRSMRMPHRPGEAVYVDGQRGNPLTRDRANKVHLHPFTGEVLGVQRSSELGVVPFITDVADPLHFGYFGGIWTKVLWCLLGLMLSFSILAGTYLWVVRSGPSRRASSDGTPAPRGLRPFSWLRGAVVATAFTLAYLVVVTWATVESIQEYAPQRPAPERVADVQVGPYRARIDCAAPCRPAEGATFTVRFRGAGLPNYPRATLGPRGEPGQRDTLGGPARAPSATVEAASDEVLKLCITGRGGAAHTAAFAAPAAGVAPGPEADATWPETAPGVWGVVGLFAALTTGFVGGWLVMVGQAFRAKQRKQLTRQRRGAQQSTSLPQGATLPPRRNGGRQA